VVKHGGDVMADLPIKELESKRRSMIVRMCHRRNCR
jgi:hypothetical protein